MRKWISGHWHLIWPGVVGVISLFVAVMEAFHLSEDVIRDQRWLTAISLFYVFGITALVFGFSVYRIIVTIRKERYANISGNIHDIMHNTRNLMTFMDQTLEEGIKNKDKFEGVQEQIRSRFVDIMTDIAHLFSMLTGTTCRACIKTTYRRDGGPIFIQTFARDKRSDDDLFDLDEKRRNSLMDPLSENSEFLRMMKMTKDGPGDWHFICGNIEKNEHFKTTSFAAYVPEKGTQFKAERRLPYRSTVCSAIGQAPGRGLKGITGPDGEHTIVLGFLAVDSESRNVFDSRWDVQLVYAFADALLHPLNRYIDAFRRVSTNGA